MNNRRSFPQCLIAYAAIGGLGCGAAPGYEESNTPYLARAYVGPPVANVLVAAPASSGPGPSQILLLAGRSLGRPAEVVGIIDEHAPSGSEDMAEALMRQRAVALGADAVLGVDYHHGEEGGSTHFSGMAVRFLSVSP